MKLGLIASRFSAKFSIDIELLRRAEALGYHSAWTSEAYGNDAVTAAAWILANTNRLKVGTGIMQVAARTPATTAMTAMSLDHLSNGRFILGLGPSGPQVVEGWHGVSYSRPLTRMREHIAIVRQIIGREAPLEMQGYHYKVPFTGPGTTGLGKPLKSILHGNRVPIYTAAITPKGVSISAELADGLLPLWMSPERFDLLEPYLNEGFAKAVGKKDLDNFCVCPSVKVRIGDDLDQCRLPAKQELALYVGGMGARGKNFYNDFVKRLGYESAAIKIQDKFLAGEKQQAIDAVPDELVDDLFLVGSKEQIRERLGAWREAAEYRHVDTMIIDADQPEALEFLAEELL